MKRFLKTIFSLAIILALFSACSESETIDFGSFVDRYNSSGDRKLDFSEVVGEERDGKTVYCFSFPSNNESGKKILTKLFENENKKLSECRIIIAKKDENGKKEFSSEDAAQFLNEAKNALMAFSGFNEEKAKSVLLELGIGKEETFLKNGERKTVADEYYVFSLSNDVAFEVIIYNTWLKKVEETEKPESRPIFDETTKIRTETVPHK
ncbi:MAG: hypothetical protein Q4D20_10865 [Clostridia bacterium]|nr:hypothetical protein [Clostridia bacterium]